MPDEPHIKKFLRLQSRFMAYLMAITRDLEAAQEIFQNAAVAVIEGPKDGGDIRDFEAWAKEVVRRQALYHLRQEGRAAQRVRAIEPALLDGITQAFMEDAADGDRLDHELSALRRCVRR